MTLFLWTLVLWLIQSLPVWGYFNLLGVEPNLLLIYLVILAFRKGWKTGLALGIGMGLLIDMSSHTMFINLITFPLIGVLVGVTKNHIFKNELLLNICWVAGATLLYRFIYTYFMAVIFDQTVMVLSIKLIRLLMLHGLLTGVLWFFIPAPDEKEN